MSYTIRIYRYISINIDMTDSQDPDQEAIKTEEPAVTKYSIVLRFWSEPQEIAVTNIVSCQNKITKELFYKFFDSTGRLWDNVPERDVIMIKNFPDKEDVDDFMRLKQETERLNNMLLSKKPETEDISIR